MPAGAGAVPPIGGRITACLVGKATDFRSLVLVNLFAKFVRQTKAAGFGEFTVSEMLPDLDQLWLPDSAGRRYSSELRFVVYDEMA